MSAVFYTKAETPLPKEVLDTVKLTLAKNGGRLYVAGNLLEVIQICLAFDTIQSIFILSASDLGFESYDGLQYLKKFASSKTLSGDNKTIIFGGELPKDFRDLELDRVFEQMGLEWRIIGINRARSMGCSSGPVEIPTVSIAGPTVSIQNVQPGQVVYTGYDLYRDFKSVALDPATADRPCVLGWIGMKPTTEHYADVLLKIMGFKDIVKPVESTTNVQPDTKSIASSDSVGSSFTKMEPSAIDPIPNGIHPNISAASAPPPVEGNVITAMAHSMYLLEVQLEEKSEEAQYWKYMAINAPVCNGHHTHHGYHGHHGHHGHHRHRAESNRISHSI